MFSLSLRHDGDLSECNNVLTTRQRPTQSVADASSSPRLSQQQTHTSSLALGTQANSVQNCPLNVQESVSTNQPPYLRNLLHIYQPLRCLRSASQNLLSIPFCTTNSGKRSFSFSSLLQFGMNYLPLSGSQTHWTPLIVD